MHSMISAARRNAAAVVAAALLHDAPCRAATYYVATGGADGNSGSITDPWATIEHAGRTAAPGDTILIRGGVYGEGEIWLRAEYGHCGDPTGRVVIAAHPGEQPILTNGSRPFIVACDFLRIEGLHFRNGKGIAISGLDRNTVQLAGNTFIDDGTPQNTWAPIDSHGQNILIENNVCDLHGNTVGTQGHCIYVAHGSDIVVRGNTLRGMTGYGVHVFDQRRSEDPPGFTRRIENVLIDGNRIFASRERSGIIVSAYDQAIVRNVTIENNLLVGHALAGIVVRPDTQNVRIWNNTIYGNGDDAIVIDAGAVSGVLVENNLIDTTGAPADHISAGAPGVLVARNLYWPAPARLVGVTDALALVSAPGFVDAPALDFELGPTSAALDAGIVLPLVTTDLDGRPRPQDVDNYGAPACELGAFERHAALVFADGFESGNLDAW